MDISREELDKNILQRRYLAIRKERIVQYVQKFAISEIIIVYSKCTFQNYSMDLSSEIIFAANSQRKDNVFNCLNVILVWKRSGSRKTSICTKKIERRGTKIVSIV